MYLCADDLLVNLVALTPKLARQKFRLSIFESWDWSCAYCGKKLDQQTATIDHIVPKHKGGQNLRHNLVCSCGPCNKDKSTLDWEFWFQGKSFFCETRRQQIESWVNDSRLNIELRVQERLRCL